jgi:hypothetical protein
MTSLQEGERLRESRAEAMITTTLARIVALVTTALPLCAEQIALEEVAGILTQQVTGVTAQSATFFLSTL